MHRALHRPSSSRERVLAPPGAGWHGTEAAGTAPYWRDLLAACDPRRLPRWRRITGWCADAGQRMQRLLDLHGEALAAEIAGRWTRADFLWNESHAALARMWPRSEQWDAVARAVGAEVTGAQLRLLLRDELFIDGHAALANGHLAPGRETRVGDRGFMHARWISRLLELGDPGVPDAFDTAVRPALIAELALLQENHRFDEAIARLRSEARLARTPDLVDRHAVLIYQRALAQLADEADGHELEDAASLAKNIRELEALRARHPQRLLSYDLLARLHHLHSVRLGNGGRLADAMVASAKAAAWLPAFEAAEQAMVQLADNMRALQERMRVIEGELRAQPGKQLNADGLRMKAEAARGFAPLDRLRKSGDLERLGAERQRAELAAAAEPPADVEASADGGASARGPVFVIPPAEVVNGSRVPALRWWFGTQDVGTRALAAGALACGVVSVGVAATQAHDRQVRDEAVVAIRSAGMRAPEPVMAAAERFLSAKPLTGVDARRDEVVDAYSHAFTEWFSAQEDAQSGAVRQQVARYREFVKEGDRS